MFKYLLYDTETTGLHIITDKPFLFQYAVIDEQLNPVYTGYFNPKDTANKNKFINLLKTINTIVGHNIKFDIHMAINDGIDQSIFENKNYIDTAVLARLAINHDKQTDAAFTTAMKKLAVRYLGVDSADEERKLKAELSRLTSIHKMKMRQAFISAGLWDENLNKTEDTIRINEIYSSWNKVFHKYPIEIKQCRNQFLKDIPAPTYEDCANIISYGMKDIDIDCRLFKMFYTLAVQLHQTETIVRVSKAVYPLVLMERKGMTVDIEQVLKDRNKLIQEMSKTKIIDPRTGNELSIGQHAKLKELYEYESGDVLESADKDVRNEIEDRSPAAKTATYLAKMDKYLSTYITGILNKLTYVDGEYKVFTQYNLAGTITGRLSSDFQQFPKEPLELADGTSVNIRGWFIVPKKDKYMFYFDKLSKRKTENSVKSLWANTEPSLS